MQSLITYQSQALLAYCTDNLKIGVQLQNCPDAGNRRLTELVVAFTGCPEAAPDVPSQRVSELFAREVLPAFEALLQKNDTLRFVVLSTCL